MRTAAHGLSVDVPVGWEARIVRLAESAPYLHVASFALTADVGQFGAGATAAMGPDTAFAALVEYVVDRHATPGAGLFASRRWQGLRRALLPPTALFLAVRALLDMAARGLRTRPEMPKVSR